MRRIHILFISHLSVWRWRCFTPGRSLPFSTDKLRRAREREMDLQGYLDAEQKNGQRDVLELLLLMDLMGTLVLCESNWKCLCIWRHLRNSGASQLWLRGAQGGPKHLRGHSRTPGGIFQDWGGGSGIHLCPLILLKQFLKPGGTWGGGLEQSRSCPARTSPPGQPKRSVLAGGCDSRAVGCPGLGTWLWHRGVSLFRDVAGWHTRDQKSHWIFPVLPKLCPPQSQTRPHSSSRALCYSRHCFPRFRQSRVIP